MLTNNLHFAAPSNDVRVQKLSHAVADRLRSQIVSGERKAGDKLPAETDLLEQFKVSRPTIREALRILEAEALISLGRGARAGATVLVPTVERAAEYAAMVLVGGGTTLTELHEARMILEPSMIMQLAKKGDKLVLGQLQARLDSATQLIADGDLKAGAAHLNEFHAVLVRASENQALILIIELLKFLSQNVVDVVVEGSGDDKGALRKNLQKTVTAYQQLVELLREGKADDAETFWRRYMTRAQAFLNRTGLGSRKLEHRARQS